MKFSKTILGAFVAVIGYLGQADVITILPPKWAAIVTAAGALLTAIGLRHAVKKAEVAR